MEIVERSLANSVSYRGSTSFRLPLNIAGNFRLVCGGIGLRRLPGDCEIYVTVISCY